MKRESAIFYLILFATCVAIMIRTESVFFAILSYCFAVILIFGQVKNILK